MNTETVIRYLTMAVVVVTSLPVHELAHGLTANWLGDHTAKDQGRLTLNPFAHLDLFGTLALLLFGFGWAKPVPINPSRFKKPKRDMALTALAGPLSNILLALVLMAIFKVYMFYGNINSTAGLMFGQIIYTILWTNLTLAVFNLLPVPPLGWRKDFRCSSAAFFSNEDAQIRKIFLCGADFAFIPWFFADPTQFYGGSSIQWIKLGNGSSGFAVTDDRGLKWKNSHLSSISLKALWICYYI